MACFSVIKPEEFLLLLQNFNITVEASVMLVANAKLQYINMLLCVEALSQFNTLWYQVGSTTIAYLNQVILGLGTYFFPMNLLKRAICRIMRKQLRLNVRL